jgi:hypothetical protein
MMDLEPRYKRLSSGKAEPTGKWSKLSRRLAIEYCKFFLKEQDLLTTSSGSISSLLSSP